MKKIKKIRRVTKRERGKENERMVENIEKINEGRTKERIRRKE